MEYPKTFTNFLFDLPLSPIPTRELSDLHLKAVSAYINKRQDLNVIVANRALSFAEMDELDALYRVAADYHYALNMRLHHFQEVVSFSAFIRRQIEYTK